MLWIGLLTTFAGFVISLMSLALTAGVNGRMTLVLLGIAVSVFGIVAMINPVFVKNAVWKR